LHPLCFGRFRWSTGLGHYEGVADWDGRSYRQVSELQLWLATQSLTGVSMAGHERVLDVGCGDGRITAAISEQLPCGSILGIDPSPRMVQTADTLTNPDSPRLRFAIGDVLAMNYEDEFDVVVSFNVLHWVLDQHAALIRIRTALHDAGWALLQVVCQGRRTSLEQVAMRICDARAWRAHFAGFAAPFLHVDPDRYAEMAGRAGLKVVNCDVTDRRWDFGSREAFERWCRVGFDSWTARLPDDRAAEAFVADVIDAYSAVTGSTQRFEFMQLRARLQPARVS
jgi:trans-aconitate 2-methyltransferase